MLRGDVDRTEPWLGDVCTLTENRATCCPRDRAMSAWQRSNLAACEARLRRRLLLSRTSTVMAVSMRSIRAAMCATTRCTSSKLRTALRRPGRFRASHTTSRRR